MLPPVLNNVALVKGLFKYTLHFYKENFLLEKPIAFIHVDCDIYSSTYEGLFILGSNIVEGTILVFDELYNYE